MLARVISSPRRGVILSLAALLLASGLGSFPARGQAVSVGGPAGVYTVTVPAPATIEYGDGYLTIRWGAIPGPGPVPPPNPVPPPSPVPPPAPKHDGPLWLSLILPNEPTPQLAAVRDLFVGRDWGSDVGTRAYLDGQPALDRLGLTEAVAGLKPPLLVIQARPKDGATDRWPVVAKVPVGSIEDIAKAVKAVRP